MNLIGRAIAATDFTEITRIARTDGYPIPRIAIIITYFRVFTINHYRS